ncbi:MAG: lysophospholipid acyltransferase family protein [Polyangiaceae bacterium]|nr:lysophospholipid acyltransferase family protein [Polyangiaceae bacterium]
MTTKPPPKNLGNARRPQHKARKPEVRTRSLRPAPREKQVESEENLPRGTYPPDEIGIGSNVVPRVTFTNTIDVPPKRRAPQPQASRQELESQISDLESRLDQMIRASASGVVRQATAPSSDALASPSPATPALDAPPLDPSHPLASNPYFKQRWGRQGLQERIEEVDAFGYDPAFEKKLGGVLDFLHRRYFRVRVRGVENIPSAGRGIIVANHSGTFPFDGLVLRTAVARAQPERRAVRWLTEDFVHYLPFAGVFFNRMGAVRACQENAERLLNQEELVAVFPEGVKGISKLYERRYTLERFGRGGFVRLALRTGSPLVPCAIIGAEESNPMLHRLDYLPKLFGLPYLPITPTFPWLGPFGLIPAPTRWTILFGEPFSFDGYGPEAADDSVLVGRLSDRVQRSIEELIAQGLRDRKSVWLG